MIQINGVTLPDPNSYSVSVSDIDAISERNAKGLLVRDRVATKRKISLGYGILKDDQLHAIMDAIAPAFFDITFPDPVLGEITRECYVSERPAGLKYYGDQKLWAGVSLTITER